ncbi:MAG: response regulator transcription factor [Chloroflexi bacterium]|nr:response regulator transcription factor [Chloroflexota bacterium]MBI3167680.1 response regulator transcription factor [Chloroflexota bacterium]
MQPQPRKKRVLIADTTQETRRNTRVMLSTVKGVEVVAIALDGTQAVEMARLHKPDIVLLDINMSKINGLNAYKQILLVNPGTACILVSAEHHAETIQAAKALGIQNFLIKPFTEQELERAMQDVIQQLDGYRTVSARDDAQLRNLAEEYIRIKRTDEEAVKVFEEAIELPDSELVWMQTLAMIYVVRKRWSKLKVLTEKLERRTK